jgi:hypothetical protein
MHFTIDRKRLVKMLESVRRKLSGQKKTDKEVRLYACAARVFVEANGLSRENAIPKNSGTPSPYRRTAQLPRRWSHGKMESLLRDKLEPMLQLELEHRGLAKGSRGFETKLIGWVEAIS